MFKAKCVGDEIYRICLGHLITLNEDRYFIKSVLNHFSVVGLEYPLPHIFSSFEILPHFSLGNPDETWGRLSRGRVNQRQRLSRDDATRCFKSQNSFQNCFPDGLWRHLSMNSCVKMPRPNSKFAVLSVPVKRQVNWAICKRKSRVSDSSLFINLCI